MGAEAVRDQKEVYGSTPEDLVDAENISMTNVIDELDAIDSRYENSIDISSLGNFVNNEFQFRQGVEKTDESGRKYIEIGREKYYQYIEGEKQKFLGYENIMGHLYIGQYNGGKFDGKGTMIRANGEKYEGDFEYDEMTGKGIYTWVNGEKYEGDFVDGKMTGKGTKIRTNGDKYEGDWKDGKATGKGVYTWADGDKYEGDFVNGKRTGKGVYTWADGEKYEGDFVDGEMTGKGTKIRTNGNKYEGDFVDGERTGKGTMIWTNGNKYEGDFVDGERTGKGTYTWANGAIFKGEFRDNEMIQGKYIMIKGGKSKQVYKVKREGDSLKIFDNDGYVDLVTGEIYGETDTDSDGQQQMNEEGSPASIDSAEIQTDENQKYIEMGGQKYYEYSEGMTGFGFKNGVYEYYNREGMYIGEYVNGKEEGKGIYAWRDGTEYMGDWKKGRFEGKGRYTWSNGDKYEGDFVGGIRQGEGIMTWSNGNKYIGKFEKDVMTSGTIYIKSEDKTYTVVRDAERRLQITDGPDNIGKYINQTNGEIFIDGNGSPKTREYMPMEGGSIMIDGEV